MNVPPETAQQGRSPVPPRYDARVNGAAAPLTAGDLLSRDELRELRTTSAFRGAGLVLHAWAVIGGAMMAFALWPGVVTWLLAAAFIGSRQLGLAVLVHEAAHWRLFPNPKANNLSATWL